MQVQTQRIDRTFTNGAGLLQTPLPPKKINLKPKKTEGEIAESCLGTGPSPHKNKRATLLSALEVFGGTRDGNIPRETRGVSLRPRLRAAKLKIPPPSGCLAADRGVKGRGERWGSAPGSDASPRRVPHPHAVCLPRRRSGAEHFISPRL